MKNITVNKYFVVIMLMTTACAAKPELQNIRVLQDTLGLYEKFEAQISLKAEYENPFDPEQVDLHAEFTAPSGKKWIINGFYYYTDWRSLWMVRFSPAETGLWIFTLGVKDKNGVAMSEADTFFVRQSSHHGPLQISNNKRYLQFKDGTPYYGVGFWFNDDYQRFNQGRVKADELDRLKALGLNFISTYIAPLETMGSGLGRYDQNLCGRLDELLELCEQKDINLSLNLWFHSYLSETVWPGGNRRWLTNPYQLVCTAKNFFSSKKAWSYQEKLYRYMIARWGYSRALAIWFIVDEVNGTDGWASGDSLGASKWGKQVHDYFKINDPYNHLTTGTRSGGVSEFWHQGYQVFDMAAREIYEGQGFPIPKLGRYTPGDPHPLMLSYMNYASEINKLWQGYEKPAILGETGWDHTFYEPGMPGYLAMYHNALWVCLTSGTAMTPFWWAHSRYMNDIIDTNQLQSIARFTTAIPFSKLTGITPVQATLDGGNAFAMKSEQLIFGWAVKPEADVTGASVTVSSVPNGEYDLKIYHTWRGKFMPESRVKAENGTAIFTMPVLKIEDGRGQYIGQDAAFILSPMKLKDNKK